MCEVHPTNFWARYDYQLCRHTPRQLTRVGNQKRFLSFSCQFLPHTRTCAHTPTNAACTHLDRRMTKAIRSRFRVTIGQYSYWYPGLHHHYCWPGAVWLLVNPPDWGTSFQAESREWSQIRRQLARGKNMIEHFRGYMSAIELERVWLRIIRNGRGRGGVTLKLCWHSWGSDPLLLNC